MNTADLDFDGLQLIDGERVTVALQSKGGNGRLSTGHHEALLLTDSRIIHLSDGNDRRESIVASVHEVDAVEISAAGQGYSAFLWAALAFALSAILFMMIDQTVWKYAAAIVVFGMGVYLIVNRLTEPSKPSAVFKVGASEIRWSFDPQAEADAVHGFINDLYTLKAGPSSDTGGTFAPR